MKLYFIHSKKKLRVIYAIMNISRKPVTKVKFQTWICRLKRVHHWDFVQIKFQGFCSSKNELLEILVPCDN